MRWIILVLLLALGLPLKAEAHAHLLASNPPAGAVLTQAPSEIDLHFSEALEPLFSSVAVTDAAGKRVDTGGLHLAPGDAKHVIVKLLPLVPGAYRVDWHAVSVDTHRTQGGFGFTVSSLETPGGPLAVAEAWARPTVKTVALGVVYLTIVNHGGTADRLIGATSPIASRVEMHENIDRNGVTAMRPLDAVTVPSGGGAVFRPFGMHIMLVGLKRPLVLGQRFALILHFARAGDVPTMVTVARAAPGAMTGMKM